MSDDILSKLRGLYEDVRARIEATTDFKAMKAVEHAIDELAPVVAPAKEVAAESTVAESAETPAEAAAPVEAEAAPEAAAPATADGAAETAADEPVAAEEAVRRQRALPKRPLRLRKKRPKPKRHHRRASGSRSCPAVGAELRRSGSRGCAAEAREPAAAAEAPKAPEIPAEEKAIVAEIVANGSARRGAGCRGNPVTHTSLS